MHIFRIMLVFLFVSVILLPGTPADATLITRDIKFRIDAIGHSDSNYNWPSGKYKWHNYEWSLNDTFLLSFEYEDIRTNDNDALAIQADITFSLFKMGAGFDEINDTLENFPVFNPVYWLRPAGGMYINVRPESLTGYYIPSNPGRKQIFLDGNYDTDDWNGCITFYDNQNKSVTLSVEKAVVPEPSTVILLGSGLIGLVWFGRKRKS